MARCSCGGLLQVVEHALERTVYECRRCRKRWQWKVLEATPTPVPTPAPTPTPHKDRYEFH